MGKVTDWFPVSKENITLAVQDAVETNRKNEFGFLYIRCGDILQSLTFPPILKKADKGSVRSKINVNVIVLDSIARPHFYRILPRSVAALRRIARDPRIKVTALDFELFQSVGQQTFDNMRPFFSGIIKGECCLNCLAGHLYCLFGRHFTYPFTCVNVVTVCHKRRSRNCFLGGFQLSLESDSRLL